MDNGTYGSELKDQFNTTSQFCAEGLSFINDVRDYFKERALLEREYATKLSALSKKWIDKKLKKKASFAVGDSPQTPYSDTLAMDQPSAINAWTTILNETENLAKDRTAFGDQITTKVVEELKKLYNRVDDTRKKHVSFYQRLQTDRNRCYADKDKAMQKYHEACEVVELSRQKQEKAEERDRTAADRAKEKYSQDMIDMNNCKNTFLISIEVANRQKEKYFTSDLPSLMDHLQDLNETRIRRTASICKMSIDLESQLFEQASNRFEVMITALNEVNPKFDSAIFIRYNRNMWSSPANFEFQPSPIWMDTPDLVDDEPAKVFLSNKLAKSKKRLLDIKPIIQAKDREINGLKTLQEAYSNNTALGDPDEVTEGLLESIRHRVLMSTVATTLETEVEIIIEKIGDMETDQVPHEFKMAAFTIPTTCDHCQGMIWGLARQGFTCKECSYNCHAKCEMKVPATCKKGASNTNNNNTMHSVVASESAAAGLEDLRSPSLTAVAIYAYDARGEGELTIAEGDIMTVIEEDMDGSGWIKVEMGGSEGLVPKSYVEVQILRRVRALYDYDAREGQELSIKEGDILLVGQDTGDGWLSGTSESGMTGLVPAAYVEGI